MLDTPSFTPAQLNRLRRFFHSMNHFMVFMWKIGLGRLCNVWPAGFGRIMVIRHIGRKSGKEYLTPVNYAPIGDEIYCTAGFGPGTDWYRNILAQGHVELWLPDGRRRAQVCEVSDSPDRLKLLRQIVIASGFAGPLLGVDPKKTDDEKLERIGRGYRLVRFSLES
jgi:deazaflavin-dependent oxidoreductase (nitroreductase family)